MFVCVFLFCVYTCVWSEKDVFEECCVYAIEPQNHKIIFYKELSENEQSYKSLNKISLFKRSDIEFELEVYQIVDHVTSLHKIEPHFEAQVYHLNDVPVNSIVLSVIQSLADPVSRAQAQLKDALANNLKVTNEKNLLQVAGFDDVATFTRDLKGSSVDFTGVSAAQDQSSARKMRSVSGSLASGSSSPKVEMAAHEARGGADDLPDLYKLPSAPSNPKVNAGTAANVAIGEEDRQLTSRTNETMRSVTTRTPADMMVEMGGEGQSVVQFMYSF